VISLFLYSKIEQKRGGMEDETIACRR